MPKIPKGLRVTYKYAIKMTHVHDTYSNVMKKWADLYLKQIYNGRYLLLVSPIFSIGERLFILPTLDVDTTFSEGLIFLKKFFRTKKRRRYWFAEYTGRNSFHIYSRFLVLLPNNIDTSDISTVRSMIFSPLKNTVDMEKVDVVSSIRNIPILRIGYRHDVGRMAIPVLKLDPQWIKFASSYRGFERVFDIKSLRTYILNYIIPPVFVSYQKYKVLARV